MTEALKFDKGKPAFSLLDEPTFAAMALDAETFDAAKLIRAGRWSQALGVAAQILCPTNPDRAIRLETARVLTYGAEKYDRDNWRRGMRWSRLVDAALRHWDKFEAGEVLDDESGLPHLGHVGACLMFLIVYKREGLGEDDR